MVNAAWAWFRQRLNIRTLISALWLIGLLHVAYYGMNTLFRVVLALALMPPLYGLFVVLMSLKTLLFLLVAGGMWMTAMIMQRWGWEGWAFRWRYNLLVAGVMGGVMLVFGLVGAAMAPDPQINRFGFYPPFGLSTQAVNRTNRPDIPDSQVKTNELGYRDQEWSPARPAGVKRALIVGDSFVYGYGIADQNDTLDNALERELETRTNQPWEVLNIAILPSALPYYSRSLLEIGKEAQPDVLVMSFLNDADMEPVDVPMVKHGMPKVLLGCLDYFDVIYDLMAAGYLYTIWNVGGRFPGSEEVLRPGFEELLAWMQETDTPLIIWWPMGKSNPFFDRYEGDGLVSFVVNQLNGPIGLPHFFPNDGHPTPEGNRFIAKRLADQITNITYTREDKTGQPTP